MVLNDSQEYSANILAIGSESLHSGLNSTIYLLCDLGLVSPLQNGNKNTLNITQLQ